MSIHDMGIRIDAWIKAEQVLQARLNDAVVKTANDNRHSPDPGQIALIIRDLEAMKRLTNGPETVPVHIQGVAD